MEKYRKIESENGFFYPATLVTDIDTMQGQGLLKNMSWRVIEEVGESLEAYFNSKDDPIHAKEELADGLHFFTELLILSGYDSKDLIVMDLQTEWYYLASRDIETIITNVVLTLGISMNCLKMKPWKQTHVKTDKEKFKSHLILAYNVYIRLMLKIMKPLEVLNLYFSKSNVNKFRIRSNY
jgi:hypothetical protein